MSNIPLLTRCLECKYTAMTWHESIDNLNRCRKCDGHLEILAKELKGGDT